MRIVVMGRTCSGKSTFVNMLKEQGLETYKTYTTRPQRDKNDDGYHFITDKEAAEIPDKERCLKTENNGYQYFGKKDEILSGSAEVFILDPDGFYELAHMFREEKVLLFYINADSMSRVSRALKRPDGVEKFQSRDAAENERFLVFEQTLLWMLNNPGVYSPKNVEVYLVNNNKERDLDKLRKLANKACLSILNDTQEETPELRKQRLNATLYTRVTDEHSKFRSKLLMLSCDEALPYALQYAVQHRICAHLAHEDMDAEDAAALLSKPNILSEIYMRWEEDPDGKFKESIQNAVKNCAKECK